MSLEGEPGTFIACLVPPAGDHDRVQCSLRACQGTYLYHTANEDDHTRSLIMTIMVTDHDYHPKR